MIRVKRQTTGSYALSQATISEEGTPLHVDAPYTAAIYDSAGTLVDEPEATWHSHTFHATVPYTEMTDLDTYEVVWSGVVDDVTTEWTTTLELVGGYLFEIADLRAQDRAFQDVNKYPSDTLRQIRTWVEDVIEGPRAANVAFVPRGRRVTLDGTSRGSYAAPYTYSGIVPVLLDNKAQNLVVPDFEVREIYSCSINGTALGINDLAAIETDDNRLWRASLWPYGKNNVTVHYEHGHTRPPGAITRAALILAREYLVKSDLPGRATATSIGDQMFRLTIAGRDGVTGLPDVDAAIDQFGRKGFGIA